jgi:hypothetical protein
MQVTSAECAFFAEWVGFVVSFASQIIKDLLKKTHTHTHTQKHTHTRTHQRICAYFFEISQVECDFALHLRGFFLILPLEMLIWWSRVGSMVITNRVSYGSSMVGTCSSSPSTTNQQMGKASGKACAVCWCCVYFCHKPVLSHGTKDALLQHTPLHVFDSPMVPPVSRLGLQDAILRLLSLPDVGCRVYGSESEHSCRKPSVGFRKCRVHAKLDVRGAHICEPILAGLV